MAPKPKEGEEDGGGGTGLKGNLLTAFLALSFLVRGGKKNSTQKKKFTKKKKTQLFFYFWKKIPCWKFSRCWIGDPTLTFVGSFHIVELVTQPLRTVLRA